MTTNLSSTALPINPLASPKGVYLKCELCGKTAHLMCKGCRVTYYCGQEHEILDKKGIHHKICDYLGPLRSAAGAFGSENERAGRDEFVHKQQTFLFELTKTEAHKLLFEAQYDLAIPAALQALRFSTLISGQDSIDLVPTYLLLGKASVGQKQYTQAEEYLSLAKWAILKVKECSNEIRGMLHRNIGLLYVAKESYEDALKELALDIYYNSIFHHPDHISVCGGYYQMGIVFHKQNHIDLVGSFYDKVVTILKNTLKPGTIKLDDAQVAEAINMLQTIFTFRVNYSKGAISTGEVDYVFALLYRSSSDISNAKEHISRALTTYESALGREHSLTIEVRKFMKDMLSGISDKGRSP